MTHDSLNKNENVLSSLPMKDEEKWPKIKPINPQIKI